MNINTKKWFRGLKIVFASYILALIFNGLVNMLTTGQFGLAISLPFIIMLAIATMFMSQFFIGGK